MNCTILCEHNNESIVFRFSGLDFFSHGWWLAHSLGVAIYFVQTMYFYPRKNGKKWAENWERLSEKMGSAGSEQKVETVFAHVYLSRWISFPSPGWPHSNLFLRISFKYENEKGWDFYNNKWKVEFIFSMTFKCFWNIQHFLAISGHF